MRQLSFNAPINSIHNLYTFLCHITTANFITLGNKMEIRHKLITLGMGWTLLFALSNPLLAYDKTVVYAQDSHISQNLNLNAVASIFGQSEDLYEFERRLNDPDRQISNLDLNRDGNVDYLRVIETKDNGMHLIIIQAVLGDDYFHDVATIEIQRDDNDMVVQIIGDSRIYGDNYFIEPVYVNTPAIYSYFWAGWSGGVVHHAYYSPYRWGYYPPRYRPWRPHPVPYYREHINRHIRSDNYYRHTRQRTHIEHRRHEDTKIRKDYRSSGKRHDRFREEDRSTRHPDRSKIQDRERIPFGNNQNIYRDTPRNLHKNQLQHQNRHLRERQIEERNKRNSQIQSNRRLEHSQNIQSKSLSRQRVDQQSQMRAHNTNRKIQGNQRLDHRQNIQSKSISRQRADQHSQMRARQQNDQIRSRPQRNENETFKTREERR